MTIKYQDRVVRVFISSTFKDMHAEREELIKHVFPELRKRCRERQVEFVDVDLRWGVTEEQAERGEVLPICLAEIERCHPYFIGLLGERYGGVADKIDDELIEDQPWLKAHQQSSYTELEICHGVLNNKEMKGLAHFYLRDPEVSNQIESDLSEQPNYQPEPPIAKDKLNALKERIDKSGYPVTKDYPDAKAVGQSILDDLWAAIDKRFPETETPSALEQERLEHEAFAEVRRKVYIGRQEYYDALNGYVRSDGPPLVLLGESGSGKSALLANWAYRYKKENPDDFMLLHFIGGTPDSADYTQLIRRIMMEIKECIEHEKSLELSNNIVSLQKEDDDSIPTDPQKLIKAFPLWLVKAAAIGKFILVLDGLNQLEDQDNAPDLTWLPNFIPPNVRLIVSALPGRSLEALQKREWPNLTIELLESDERNTLITDYLSQFSKSLEVDQIEKITDAPQTTSPLYLKTLLDELRVFGIHEQLNERIEHYLQATTIDALFNKMLERMEQDYEQDHPGLTEEVMSLIWAARHGLSESELLELMNIPQAIWSPLYLAIEESLVSRSGLLNFSHGFLRQAVQQRYLKEPGQQQTVHIRIADYFQVRELNQRKVKEFPWQLTRAGEWDRLYSFLADLSNLKVIWKLDSFETRGYWTQLDEKPQFCMTYAYRQVLDAPGKYIEYLSCLAALLDYKGHPREALQLQEYLVNHYRQSDQQSDLLELLMGLHTLTSFYTSRNKIENAQKALAERKKIQEKMGVGLLGFSGEATMLYQSGNLEGAWKLWQKEEELARTIGNSEALADAIFGQALVLNRQNDPNRSLDLYREADLIYRQLGKKGKLAASLNNQSNILSERGELNASMELLKEQESIARELGDMDLLQSCLGNQGINLKKSGGYNSAFALLKEQEKLCRELDKKQGLKNSLENQATIFLLQLQLVIRENCMQEALRITQEVERVAREAEEKDLVLEVREIREKLRSEIESRETESHVSTDHVKNPGNAPERAFELLNTNDIEGAWALLRGHELVSRDSSDNVGLVKSLFGQFMILVSTTDRQDEAICRGEEALRLAKQHMPAVVDVIESEIQNIRSERSGKDEPSLSKKNRESDIVLQINDLMNRGDLSGAIVLCKELERLCHGSGNKEDLQFSLGVQGNILFTKGDLDGASKLFSERVQLCRELSNMGGLAASLGNLAVIRRASGKLEEAAELHSEEELLWRELGNRNGLQIALLNRGTVLHALGKLEEAMQAMEEQEQISSEEGFIEALGAGLKIQGLIFQQWGELEEAKAALENYEQLSVSLATRAVLLSKDMKNPEEALPVAEEAFRLAREYGSNEMACEFEDIVKFVRSIK